MEYCAPMKRTMAGMVFELMWAIGLMFLGGVAYAVRDWRNLQLFLAIPTILTLLWTWLIPESMHWLYTNHREFTAFKVCVQTAKYNKNYGTIESDHRYWKENIKNEELRSKETMESLNQTPTMSFWRILQDVFKTSCLRKHIFIMACTWFVVAMAYYGILFFMPTLTGDRHLNFILSGVIEFLVYMTMYFVLAKFGRRKPLMFYLYMNGVLLVVIGVCSSYHVEGKLDNVNISSIPFLTIQSRSFRVSANNCYFACSWNNIFSLLWNFRIRKRIISYNKSWLRIWNMWFHGQNWKSVGTIFTTSGKNHTPSLMLTIIDSYLNYLSGEICVSDPTDDNIRCTFHTGGNRTIFSTRNIKYSNAEFNSRCSENLGMTKVFITAYYTQMSSYCEFFHFIANIK